MKDLIIIGGGPAAVAGGVYAARKHLYATLIAAEIGGQSVVSEGIENWIGTENISGAELAKRMLAHLKAHEGHHLKLVIGGRVEALQKTPEGFKATTNDGAAYEAKAVLVASGASRRKLDIPGAAQFENKGVTYCASCDGPLFAGQDVAVVGGGNAGFETAAQLLAYAKSVTLMHRHEDFKADKITVEKVSAHKNMRIIRHAEPTEVLGGQFVTGLKYLDKNSGETKELSVSGIFVEAGVIPNTGFVQGLLELDSVRHIVVNPRNQRAYLASQTPQTASDARRGKGDEEAVQESTAAESHGSRNAADDAGCGVWAAGDVTDGLYHQNNIAAGDGVKALEDLYLWLKTR